MSKDPAFLFYPNDYLGGTMGMTFEMKGAYIDLLIFQFNNHQFTESEAKQVLSICFENVWQVLQHKFKQEGKFYFNERLREEINKRKAFSESRRINALHEKKPREKKISTSKAYAQHMGNENENRNKDNKSTFSTPSIQEITAYCLERKNKIDPQYFLDYQTARDWKLKGGSKVKDWRAVIRTWEKNDFNTGGNNGTGNGNFRQPLRTARDIHNQAGLDEADILAKQYYLKHPPANGNT